MSSESPKRRALGKGLESLLPRPAVRPAAHDPGRAEEQKAASAQGGEPAQPFGVPLELAVSQIERNPFQTRHYFDTQQLRELGTSIEANGVIQPIVVRPLADGRYQLISGERRWLASKLVNRPTIPAVVRDVPDAQALEITIVENLQRADLNPLEQARAFDRLVREFGLTTEQIATRTGKDRSTVTNFIRLLRLPPELHEKLEKGELTMGHAKALLALSDPKTLHLAATRVLEQAMNVRQTEKYVQSLLEQGIAPSEEEKPKSKPAEDPNVREARELLQRSLGLKVKIEDRKGRGKLTIEYGSVEDFDELMLRLMPGER